MRRLAPILAAALLAGCASSGFNSSGAARAPAHAGEVEILREFPRAGTYDLLGVVTVKGVALTSDARMYAELKDRAAFQGADAVVPQGEIRTRPTSDGGEDRTLAAYAIRRRP